MPAMKQSKSVPIVPGLGGVVLFSERIIPTTNIHHTRAIFHTFSNSYTPPRQDDDTSFGLLLAFYPITTRNPALSPHRTGRAARQRPVGQTSLF